jgi:acyl-coenzyme A synthetase/AMP-(fatty) acid ligase
VDSAFELRIALAHWHARLPPHGRPREIAIAAALPMLANGKIDRSAAAAVARRPVSYDDVSS